MVRTILIAIILVSPT